jgi:uncharacterized protein (DUF362 family)
MIPSEHLTKTPVHLERFSLCTEDRLIHIAECLGLANAIAEANSIVVKPNLCAGTIYAPGSAVVTNPAVLDLLVRSLIRVNPRATISIVESDSIGLGLTPLKFEHQGYKEIFSRFPQVQLVDLSRSAVAIYPTPRLHFEQGIVLPRIVVESDLFISLGKIKTHTNTVVTGILKNQFGCLAETDKDKYHPYLPDVIADVNAVIKPALSLIEGCPAMEGKGPIHGSPVDLDLLILGVDPVAVDATMARVMMFKPHRIQTLLRSELAGLGTFHEEEIELGGVPLEEVQRPFAFISNEHRFYVGLGFRIQRLGNRIHDFGHLVHSVQGTYWGLTKLFKKASRRYARR